MQGKTFTSTSGAFSVTFFGAYEGDGALRVYKRNHNKAVLRNLRGTPNAVISFGGYAYTMYSATMTIDITSLMASLPHGAQALLVNYRAGQYSDSLGASVYVCEGVNPYDYALTAPADSYNCALDDWQRNGYHFPNVIYSGAAFNSDVIFYSDIDGAIPGTSDYNDGEFSIPPTSRIVGGADYPTTVPVKPTDKGAFALLEWKAIHGRGAWPGETADAITKRAVWELISVKANTNTTEYSEIGDGYRASKEPSLSLRVRIGGLDAYGAWYYSDIISSGDVRIALSENDDVKDEANRVEVQTKDYTVNYNSGANYYEIVVDLAYKGYVEN